MGKLPKGVSLTAQGRFQARIYRNGASRHLGVFDDIDEAAAAYRAAFLSRATMPIANAPATDEPAPVPTEKPRETPTPEPQPAPAALTPETAQEPQRVPGAIPPRGRAVQPGHCPACDSALYALAPGAVNERDKLCVQCGYRLPWARFDEQGHRIYSSEPENFEPAGISRAQYADHEWMAAHVQKGTVRV